MPIKIIERQKERIFEEKNNKIAIVSPKMQPGGKKMVLLVTVFEPKISIAPQLFSPKTITPTEAAPLAAPARSQRAFLDETMY